VEAALKAIKVPNVRWPGGCFADEYHWRNGIGAQRNVTLNPNWGGVVEPNTFGTHEFMDFLDQIGAEAYGSVNLGSGTAHEAADWLEYMTAPTTTTLAKERAANGHAAPYKIAYLGVGNESWDCGGNMTPDYYVSQMKIYSRFVRDYNPAQQDKDQIQKIAVGPGGAEPSFVDWTETVMKAYQQHTWSWDINGLSMHSYTVVRWEDKFKSLGFGESEYAQFLKETLTMDGLINKYSAIMDKYDPQKKVALLVDEWGSWYAPLPGSNPGFLVQQNSMRDAILAALNLNIFARHADRVRGANIAQMINVLQSMILTDGDKMVLTPTYHVFEMYKVHQGATLVPLEVKGPNYEVAGKSVAAVHATASRNADENINISLVNLDLNRPVRVSTKIPAGRKVGAARILTASALNVHNTFEQPDAVKPVAFDGAKIDGETLTVDLPTKSIVVIELR
jgi:alpha-N-arabinofuranosidase